MWTVGIPMDDYQTKMLEKASLVITIGYDIIEYAPAKWHLNNADIIHIDSMPADINKNYQPQVEVVGSIPNSLERIMEKAARLQEPKYYLEMRKKMVAEHESYANDMSFPVKPQKALIDCRSVMARTTSSFPTSVPIKFGLPAITTATSRTRASFPTALPLWVLPSRSDFSQAHPSGPQGARHYR